MATTPQGLQPTSIAGPASRGQSRTPRGPRPALGGRSGIRVRMYRVGFGDFFLLSLAKGARVAHVLVDCGVHAKPTNSIDEAIEQLKTDTGGDIALIVMTHRHADHVSGFGTGTETFKGFRVGRVWMPWFENPKDPTATRFQANLTALAARLHLGLTARAAPGDRQFADMAANITGAPAVDAMGVAGSSNDNALATLHSGFAEGKEGSRVDYLKAGDLAPLPPALERIGVKATILGPPIDPDLIGEMDERHHQYLADLAADEAATTAGPIFADRFTGLEADYAAIGDATVAAAVTAVKSSQPDVLQALAAKADNTLNNQSVVILFEFNGRKLLFAGDAQWGNWQNFLFGGALGSPGHAALTPGAKAILSSIDFYKVGHHGSTNATPIDALEAMRDGVVAMCSTAEHAYGSEENGSEVPRKPLMDALRSKTHGHLARSDQVDVEGAAAIGGALDPAFSAPTGRLFIDYDF